VCKWDDTDAPIFGDRDGETYSPPRDRDRLNRQARLVYLAILDDRWHTLPELASVTGQPEASISARLRDLRKPRFGGHIVERRYAGNGLWEYRYAGLSDAPQVTAENPTICENCGNDEASVTLALCSECAESLR